MFLLPGTVPHAKWAVLLAPVSASVGGNARRRCCLALVFGATSKGNPRLDIVSVNDYGHPGQLQVGRNLR